MSVDHSQPPSGRPPRDDSPRLPPIHEAAPKDNGPDAWPTAFTRLQQQVSYNTTAMEDQRRHLAELHEALRTLHGEVGTMWQHVDACTAQLRGRDDRGSRSEMKDVDILTTQMQGIAAKASEIDGLKFQLDVITRRLRRLEGHPSPPAAPARASTIQHDQQSLIQGPEQGKGYPPSTVDSRRSTISHPPPHLETRSSQEYPVHGDSRSLPSIRTLEAAVDQALPRPVNNMPGQSYPSSSHEITSHARAWSPINPAKRPAAIDTSVGSDPAGPTSPKRQRLVSIMPRSTNPEHTGPAPPPVHHSATSTSSQQSHASAALNRFIPFPTASDEATSHTSWRPDHTGRPRAHSQKSSSQDAPEPAQHRSSWISTGAAEASTYRRPGYEASQYQPTGPSSGSEYHPHAHVAGLSMHPGVVSHPHHPHHHLHAHQTSPNPDPYAHDPHNKKSRTKPTRNADGILIRKDGRPDMRSVSSAQNLRKVHAKKEAERIVVHAGPSGGSASTSAAAAGGSATRAGTAEVDEGVATSSVASREDSVDVGSVGDAEGHRAGMGMAYEVRAGRDADTPMRDVEDHALQGGMRHQGGSKESPHGLGTQVEAARHAVAA